MNAVNAQMKATWNKMCGTALLWVALAALTFVPTSADDTKSAIVATLGFGAFALGLALFSDGVKRDVVEQLRREPRLEPTAVPPPRPEQL